VLCFRFLLSQSDDLNSKACVNGQNYTLYQKNAFTEVENTFAHVETTKKASYSAYYELNIQTIVSL